jgi:NADH:ubiquinone oxidoreductase subunit 2 (subunit N)
MTMYETIKILHSYWAYLVLLILVLATFNALIKFFADKEFHAKDFRISLFALIVSHIQLLLGLILFFAAEYITQIKETGMATIMKNDLLRSNIVEHPLTMIIALVLITMGYSKHKKKLTSKSKFKMLAIFYTLALILVLAKIPWNTWLQ